MGNSKLNTEPHPPTPSHTEHAGTQVAKVIVTPRYFKFHANLHEKYYLLGIFNSFSDL